MKKQTDKNSALSDNACYGSTSIAVPLSFNNSSHYLGFTSVACSDVTIVKYSFYEYKGLYWYAVTIDEGHVMNSYFFVSLDNCVCDFRNFCRSMCWQLDGSCDLSDFVANFNKSNHESRS